MPVGEGSIKRAAGKAENGGKKTKAGVSLGQEKGKTKDAISGSEEALKGKREGLRGKEAPGEKEGLRGRETLKEKEDLKGKKQTSGRKGTGGNVRTAGEEVKESIKSTQDGRESFGIGEQLPVYLL